MSNPINGGSITISGVPQQKVVEQGTAAFFTFTGVAGSSYDFSTCSANLADTYLRVYNTQGSVLNSNDDFGPLCSSSQASLRWVCPSTSIYYILVTNFSCLPLSAQTSLTYYITSLTGGTTVLGLSPNPAYVGGLANVVGTGLESTNSVRFRTATGMANATSLSLYVSHISFRLGSNVVSGPLTLTGAYGTLITPVLSITSPLPIIQSIYSNPISRNGYLNISGSYLNGVTTISQATKSGPKPLLIGFSSQSLINVYVHAEAISAPLTLSGVDYTIVSAVVSISGIEIQNLTFAPDKVNRGQNCTLFGTNLAAVSTIYYSDINGASKILSYQLVGGKIRFQVPSDMVSQVLSLSGYFGIKTTPYLKIQLLPKEFMCVQTLTNFGALVIQSTPNYYVNQPGQAYYWTFSGLNSRLYMFSTCATSGHTLIQIFDEDGRLLQTNSGNGPACSELKASMHFKPQQDGVYYVMLADNPCKLLTQTTHFYCNYSVTSPLPIAKFGLPKTVLGLGEVMTLMDQSEHAPNQWSWSFPRANTARRALRNPTISYSVPGIYDIHLRVTNEAGTHSTSRVGAVRVIRGPSNCFKVDNYGNGGKILDEGGAQAGYLPYSNCECLLQPSCKGKVAFQLGTPRLESCCDVLSIYEGTTTSSLRIYSSQNSLSPSSLTSSGQAFLLTFVSDGSNQLSGFEVAWSCLEVATSITQALGVYSLDLYPNPSKEVLHLRYQSDRPESIVMVEIWDSYGRVCARDTWEWMQASYNQEKVLSTSALPTWMYMIKVIFQNSIATRNFVKE